MNTRVVRWGEYINSRAISYYCSNTEEESPFVELSHHYDDTVKFLHSDITKGQRP